MHIFQGGWVRQLRQFACAALICGVALHAAAAGRTISKTFAIPKAIDPEVQLWLKTYAQYHRNQVMIHDTEYMDVIYDLVDLSDISPLGDPYASFPPHIRTARLDRVEAAKDRVRAALQRLSDNPSRRDLSTFEQRIVKMFAHIPGNNKYRDAMDDKRLRSQTGLKDRFRAGIVASGRYMAHIERVFKDERIPWELSRLPFVESMFDLNAYSSVGASGIWQFMPGTAKMFGMTANKILDERNDPIAATRGAARLLRKNFESLGTWPLALNAYNSGPGRLRNAVATLGTKDIATIVRRYRGSGYGFASRNFYPEFLAALIAYENRDHYYGSITVDPPMQFDTIITTTTVHLPTMAKLASIPSAQMNQLNPGFHPNVRSGSTLIPAGYPIKVPKSAERAAVAAMRRSNPSITN